MNSQPNFGLNLGTAGGFLLLIVLLPALFLLGSMGILTLPAHAEGVTCYAQMEVRLKRDVQADPSLRLTVVGQSVNKKIITSVRWITRR